MEEVGNGQDDRHSQHPKGPALQGLSPTAEDLLEGIAATVGRLDEEFEKDRDARREDRDKIAELSGKLEAYKAAVDKMSANLLEEFQKHFARKDSPELKV